MMSKLLVYLLLLASIASAFAGRADANDGEFGGRSLGVYPRVVGNELEQYFRFESMTKSMNTEEVFDLWEACIVAVSIDYRRFGCTAEVEPRFVTWLMAGLVSSQTLLYAWVVNLTVGTRYSLLQ